MHRRRVVLLGTGTNVGKTYVGVQLVRAWRRSGISTLGLKPVETGVDPQAPLALSTDAGRLKDAADLGGAPLYSFVPPVSPHLAAQAAGMRIDVGRVGAWVHDQEDKFFGSDPDGTGGVTLVETAGGTFSPLNEQGTNFDLAALLQPSLVLLIAPDSLGVLHDVGACLRAMAAAPPDLVVLSAARPKDASTGRNAQELERVVFPRLGAAAPRDREVVTISDGEKADFLADRVLSLSLAP